VIPVTLLPTSWQDRFEEIFGTLRHWFYYQRNVAQWCSLQESVQTFTDYLTCVCVCCIQWGFSVAQ